MTKLTYGGKSKISVYFYGKKGLLEWGTSEFSGMTEVYLDKGVGYMSVCVCQNR